MGKGILGVVAGLAVWMIVVSVAGLVLRAAWPEYVNAAGTMTFTVSMKVARLSIGALATLAAGWVAALVARSTLAALVTGALLLVAFIPEHIMLWDNFPVWYHMTFLLSLVPLTYAGGRIAIDGFPDSRESFAEC
jgi:hypothetical protein